MKRGGLCATFKKTLLLSIKVNTLSNFSDLMIERLNFQAEAIYIQNTFSFMYSCLLNKGMIRLMMKH